MQALWYWMKSRPGKVAQPTPLVDRTSQQRTPNMLSGRSRSGRTRPYKVDNAPFAGTVQWSQADTPPAAPFHRGTRNRHHK